MNPTQRQSYVRSRLRWYFGVLGLLSLVPLLVTLTEPQSGVASRALAGSWVAGRRRLPHARGRAAPLGVTQARPWRAGRCPRVVDRDGGADRGRGRPGFAGTLGAVFVGALLERRAVGR